MDEHADGGAPAPGRLLIIGGGEDRCCGAGLLERFVELAGGEQARITLVTTATGMPPATRCSARWGPCRGRRPPPRSAG